MTKIQIKLREVAKIIYRRKFLNFLKNFHVWFIAKFG
jgi:hypothetical protein